MWGLGCLIWETFNGDLPKTSSLKVIGKVTFLRFCLKHSRWQVKPLPSHTTDFLKLVFTAFLVGALYERDNMKKNLVNMLVVFPKKAFNKVPPSERGGLVLRQSRLPVVMNQSHIGPASRA